MAEMNEDKQQVIIPIPHLDYPKHSCMGDLMVVSSRRMVSRYQCKKCGAFVNVIHGRSYNEIQQMKVKK